MKIGFYNPYFDSLSGGERYTLTLASHWSKVHDVSLFWDDPAIIKKAHDRLGIDLSRVKTVENVFKTNNIFSKLAVSRGFDLIFFLSDGSIPTSFAKHNILHFQVPFAQVALHPMKLFRFDAIVCNSEFTKRNIDPRLGKRSLVIYPPVEPIPGKKLKRNVILSVGRFHPLKKQDILIEAFKKMSGFELVLAGGLLPVDKDYFERLKLQAKKIRVKFYPNASHQLLSELYGESQVYWHASGYRETKPENMEHFGITTVEAMSAGCIPVVYAGGGQPEIVEEGKNGFLWGNTEELIAKTKRIVENRKTVSEFAKKVQMRAKGFATEKFTQSFDRLLALITK